MQSRVDISCIIPTHGRHQLLERTLRSVISQTLPAWEIIVTDDLGQIETRDEVARLGDEWGTPLTYVDARLTGRSTAGRNRNCGAAHATGTLLAFLDDDDVWDRRFLELALQRLHETAADLAVSWLSNTRAHTRVLWLQAREGQTADQLLYNSQLSGSNFLVRAQAFQAMGGFDPTLRVKNDTDFMVRFLDAGFTYAVVPESLVDRHSHDLGHLTSSGRSRYEGLQSYMAKHGHRMSWSQRRQMRRVMHSALRGADASIPSRIYHTTAQLVLTNPSEVLNAIRLRCALGSRRMFN